MKTYTNNQSGMGKQILPILSIFLMILAGCEKVEMPDASSEANSKSDLRNSLEPPPVYTILSIEHNCLGSALPDYDVYLRSDGSVTYRGWQNVAQKGTIVFETDAETVAYIKNLFESANFFNIQHIPSQYGDPFTATTYSNRLATKTLIDYDQGIPQLLIQIRKRAEEKLNISRFVDLKKYTLQPAAM